MTRFAHRLLVVAALSALTACIDDPAAVDDQFALTQEDAELLGLTLWRQALAAQLDFEVGGQPALALQALSPQQVPETFTNTDTIVVACPLGGEIQTINVAEIIIDAEADEITLRGAQTLTHDGCRQEVEGRTFSFFGAPSVTGELTTFYGSDDSETITGSIEGSVVVITQGTPVLCDIKVAVEDGTRVDGNLTYRARGTFCGAALDETVTESSG